MTNYLPGLESNQAQGLDSVLIVAERAICPPHDEPKADIRTSSRPPGDPVKRLVQQFQHEVDRHDDAGHGKQRVEGPDCERAR